MTKSNNNLITFLLFIPGTLWGLSFLVQEIILQTIPPLTLTMSRAILAGIPIALLLYARGGRFPSTWKGWWPYIVLGLLNNSIPFALISWGQLHIDSNLATILTSLMPLFTVFLAHFYAKGERLSTHKAAGVGLGLIGILVLVGPTALGGIGVNVWAQLAIIAAALSYSIAGIYARNHLHQQEQSRWNAIFELMSCQYITSTITLLPITLLVDRPWELEPSQASLISLLILGWVMTIGAVVIYYYIIDAAGASVASTTIYLIPINGVIWGALILNETITWQAIVALAFILSGIALVNEVGKKKPALVGG